MTGSHIALLSGPVGVGKTTVAERASRLARGQGLIVGGVLAPPAKDGSGTKIGIDGVDLLTGERRALARVGQDLGGPRVGIYSFDQGALDWATGAVERALDLAPAPCDLVIVDEIGKLELGQNAGLAPVLPRLAAGAGPWRRAVVLVRDYLQVELGERLAPAAPALFAVSAENREDVPRQIAAWLAGCGTSTECS